MYTNSQTHTERKRERRRCFKTYKMYVLYLEAKLAINSFQSELKGKLVQLPLSGKAGFSDHWKGQNSQDVK